MLADLVYAASGEDHFPDCLIMFGNDKIGRPIKDQLASIRYSNILSSGRLLDWLGTYLDKLLPERLHIHIHTIAEFQWQGRMSVLDMFLVMFIDCYRLI